VAQWFHKQNFSVCVNGRTAESVWQECTTRHREGSLPTTTVDTQRRQDFTHVGVVSVSSKEPKRDQVDIDALLSSAGTFVPDQKKVASSIIGPHSAVCTTSSQLKQENVSVVSHSQESSVDVTNGAAASASTVHSVDHETVAANESLSSRVAANRNTSRNKPLHHSTGKTYYLLFSSLKFMQK